jgi:alkanesulfonate monooxygenase SsuD/methylene tetrahydromethanopterin reductase-like flavin-dependent oxidoreductase (luciferase family)
MIRIGFQVWGQAVSWPELATTARDIERLGFDSLWSNDHLCLAAGPDAAAPDAPDGPFLEGWMTLAGFAAETQAIPLGVLVSGAGYRNPGLLVKQATALDHISGGRVTLGLGAGWHEREHRAFGFEYPSLGERIARLDEQATAIRALLDGETVTVSGRYVQMDRARNLPPPVHGRLPFLIGGSGVHRTLRIVARVADVWNGEGDPATFARLNRILDEHCAAIGRPPTEIRRTIGAAPIRVRDTREAAVADLTGALIANGLTPADARAAAEDSPLAGDEGQVAEILAAYAAAGADELIADWPAPFDLETLERLATLRSSSVGERFNRANKRNLAL